jgi:hypothetical protein
MTCSQHSIHCSQGFIASFMTPLDGPASPSQAPSPSPLYTEDFPLSLGRVSPASLGGSLLSPTPPDPASLEEERSQGGVPAYLLSDVTPSGTRPIDSWLSSSTNPGRPPRTRSLPGPDLGPALIAEDPVYGASVPCSLPADDQAEVLLDSQVPSASFGLAFGPCGVPADPDSSS